MVVGNVGHQSYRQEREITSEWSIYSSSFMSNFTDCKFGKLTNTHDFLNDSGSKWSTYKSATVI